MNEIVKEWIITDLSEIIDDVRGALENEKLWLLGSDTVEEIQAHTENIKNLCEYMDYLCTELRDVMEA